MSLFKGIITFTETLYAIFIGMIVGVLGQLFVEFSLLDGSFEFTELWIGLVAGIFLGIIFKSLLKHIDLFDGWSFK